MATKKTTAQQKTPAQTLKEALTRCGPKNNYCGLPPGTPYQCKTKLLGQKVPHTNAIILGCLVPPKGKKGPWYQLQAQDKHLSGFKGSRASRLIRNEKLGLKTVSTSVDILTQAAELWRNARIAPTPLGVEFPHHAGSSKCDPEHAAWKGYAEYEHNPSASPRFRDWEQTMDDCMNDFTGRQARKRTTHAGTARERARHKKAAQFAGEDVTGGEFLDEAERLFGTKGPKKSIHRIKHF